MTLLKELPSPMDKRVKDVSPQINLNLGLTVQNPSNVPTAVIAIVLSDLSLHPPLSVPLNLSPIERRKQDNGTLDLPTKCLAIPIVLATQRNGPLCRLTINRLLLWA